MGCGTAAPKRRGSCMLQAVELSDICIPTSCYKGCSIIPARCPDMICSSRKQGFRENPAQPVIGLQPPVSSKAFQYPNACAMLNQAKPPPGPAMQKVL